MVRIRRESNSVTLATVWENYELGKYDLSPAYQRNSVWSEEKQSFLIDSILKNVPIPPIFLHQKIDDVTGKTIYAVIDGKQRLESIFQFIKGQIPSSSEDETSPLYDDKLSGIWFSDLSKDSLSEVRKQFWRYSIPIEYVETTSKEIVDAIFDRLNRNGEPLSGQELRRSQFNSKTIYKIIEWFSGMEFWKKMLSRVDVKRMEDLEFISELVFYTLENSHFSSNQSTLDSFYTKYSVLNDSAVEFETLRNIFVSTTDYMSQLKIDYDGLNVYGVSHLYAIWIFSKYCCDNDIPVSKSSDGLQRFYTELRNQPESNGSVSAYKRTMSSSTKMKGQRTKRVECLISYVLGYQ